MRPDCVMCARHGDLHDTLSAVRDEFDGAGIADQREAMAEFGLAHEVLRLGETYLEVLSPSRARRRVPRPILASQRRDGGYMVDLQVPELDSTLGRMGRLGISRCCATPTRGAPSPSYHPARLLHPPPKSTG